MTAITAGQGPGPEGTALIVHGGAGIYDVRERARRHAAVSAAAAAAWPTARVDALAGAIKAVAALEAEPMFNAGVGARLNRDGRAELDAAVMIGDRQQFGAVMVVDNVLSPIALARLIMERSPHRILVGRGAAAFGAAHGMRLVANADLITEVRRRERLEGPGDTVGAIARDRSGHLAVAVSTGGPTGKWPGRVGDTPIPGAGYFADDDLGAACATGEGDKLLSLCLSRRAVELLRKDVPDQVARLCVEDARDIADASAGIVVVRADGSIGWAFDAFDMPLACVVA